MRWLKITCMLEFLVAKGFPKRRCHGNQARFSHDCADKNTASPAQWQPKPALINVMVLEFLLFGNGFMSLNSCERPFPFSSASLHSGQT